MEVEVHHIPDQVDELQTVEVYACEAQYPVHAMPQGKENGQGLQKCEFALLVFHQLQRRQEQQVPYERWQEIDCAYGDVEIQEEIAPGGPIQTVEQLFVIVHWEPPSCKVRLSSAFFSPLMYRSTA